MKGLAGLALLLVIVLVSLSAYLRLAHSGIGCAGWPECYGNIGAAQSVRTELQERIMEPSSSASMGWATSAHRLIASVLGLIVIVLTVLAIRVKRHRLLMLMVLALTVFLALLGLRSGGLHDPGVVMGNLSGGFAMLALLGWFWFRLSEPGGIEAHPGMSPWFLGLVVAVLVTQILFGGLTSANFAATVCTTLPDCHGNWWPGPELATAMDLSRTHQVTPSGQVIGGEERMAIHIAHRIGALVAGVLVLIAGLLAMRTPGPCRGTGIALVLLLVVEFSIGLSSVLTELPIWLAVAHNWFAALLLLALLRLLSFVKN
jgi:cytochrome c oxidase assembly protein subunit 15